ncbi:Zinc finger and BTB domain-containing protein 41 [Nibea albiflora]|uniref:Zinc finger and BTB domain-containing protein 41 n=1 Tax=Nibea albiflora TaxID=240163 RepID=A0ACB7FLI9_NIBAL|nr:Zinc finger and BTB domain-containing protein 41 [Nibea albiflora]
MKRKPCNPLRPKRSRQVSASSECAAEPGTVLGCKAPPNSGSAPESTAQIRQLAMSQYSHNLLKFLNEDRTRQKFCDVSVSVGGKLYSAHKVVLAHGSSYFHAELSKNPATAHVTLDHVEDSVFQHLLGFLYTSQCVVAETDLPALTEAARFLDMMDMLKLLCEEGDNNPVCAIQAQDEIRGSPEVEMISSDSPAGDTDIHSPVDVQCTMCSRQFNTEHSLQMHLAESHTDVHKEALTEKEKTAGQKPPTTRRSARRRKTPTKYQKDIVEYVVSTPEEKQSTVSPREQAEERAEDAGKLVVRNRANKLDENETSKPACRKDAADEEEEEGDANEDVVLQRKVVEACSADRSQQGSEVEGTEHQAVPEVEVHVPAAGSSTQSPVYPEGLAPVIIQTSNKKTLKCPKCDKTFDRAGKYESHTRVHTGEKPFQCDICLQRYSTKSNLTVHKKKHASDAPFQKKEHKCPFCSKLHASKKTLAKHVRRFHPDHIQEFLTKRKRKSEGWKCAVPSPVRFVADSLTTQATERGTLSVHMEAKESGLALFVGNPTTLREHLRIHSGEKPHLCSICGQSFRHGSSYRYKTAVHQCEVCKKEFKGKSSLEMHFRTHSGEKPHRCPECNQTFRIKKTLTKHMVIHSDARPFNCPHCSATFKRKDKLKYHVDHVHSTRFTEQPLSTLSEDKVVSISFEEPSKSYHAEPKSALQSTPPPTNLCVPVTLVPVQMAGGAQGDLNTHRASSLSSQTHSIVSMQAQGQQQNSGYQAATDLAFLEKYTLTPQPANIVHPVRPDQMLDPREQSYLGTLLGLDSASSVQNMSNSDHTH